MSKKIAEVQTKSRPSRETRHLSISTQAAQTTVLLGQGLLVQAPELLRDYRDTQVLLVSDEYVTPLYTLLLQSQLRQSGYHVHLTPIPAGEGAKTLDTLLSLYTFCQERPIERGDVVVAVGGGVVGDVAGMLAGTYLRGLDLVQLPTSLVAMVTASIGGKVGVNYRGYKNLIGLFKHPRMVLADVETLATLPDREFRGGLGELITVGMLGAPSIFESLETHGIRDTDELEAMIAAAIECKRLMVEADPFDQRGIRAKLNLGHTFGHALEKVSSFTLPHGLAVAVGLHIATRLSAALGLCPSSLPERVRTTLLALRLPTALTGYEPEEVMKAMRGDKRCIGGQIHWIVPIVPGQIIQVSEEQVPHELLAAVLHEWIWEGRS